MTDRWYTVRCVFKKGSLYEERITLWRTPSFDDAIELAEAEAAEYARKWQADYLGLAQAYRLQEGEEPVHGMDVFSLIRESSLDGEAYLRRFFDTGTELQHDL